MTDKREGLEAVIAVGSQWMERAIAAEHAREADQQAIAELRKALRALLRQTNNIEVLGEWSAEDRNHANQKKLRAEVDAVKAQALAAIAATEEGKSS